MTSGASQRGCGLRPVTRESRARPQGTPYAGADRMQTPRGVAAGLRAQARDPRVPAVGSVLATLAAAQGAPAAPSSTRRPPAPIRLHEYGRSTSAGAKDSGSTYACTGRQHHVRQRISRQERAQLHGARVAACSSSIHTRPLAATLVRVGPGVGIHMLLEHRSWGQRVAYPFDKALLRRPGSRHSTPPTWQGHPHGPVLQG